MIFDVVLTLLLFFLMFRSVPSGSGPWIGHIRERAQLSCVHSVARKDVPPDPVCDFPTTGKRTFRRPGFMSGNHFQKPDTLPEGSNAIVNTPERQTLETGS